MPPVVRRVTREELYALVWAKPMIHLAQEFGITGTGLTNICERLNVPCPPRGHWMKKAAGKPLTIFELPPIKDGVPDATDLYPTPPKPEPLPAAVATAAAAAGKATGVVVPDGTNNLHPRVKAWLAEHREKQKERAQAARLRGRDSWEARSLIPDLTDRDLYRFRVSSAIFTALEKAGGRFKATPMNGRAVFLVDGHEVECSIIEKLVRAKGSLDESREWTAYPYQHQTGLTSSGFLRVSVTTYLVGQRPQWIETEKVKIGALIPDIIAKLMSAGPILEQRKIDREESERRYREAEARRYEAQRLKEIDDKRWKRFQAFASDWEERSKLMPFIAELETRLEAEGDVTIGDRPLSAWIAWAKARTDALDPFAGGATKLFQSISKVTQWS